MTSFIRLSAWIGGVTLAMGIAGCSDRVPPPIETAARSQQPAHYPANDCRSRYSQTSQKGCVADLPHVTAKIVSR